MTKVSVVVPAYNEEKLLARCLQSLLKQNRKPDEIIVVDNNSTDRTVEIAERYNVRVIKEPKQGIMPATCTGMSNAKGDIIARCDADSIMPPEWLSVVVDELDRNPDAAGITGPGRFYDLNKLSASLAMVWYMYAYFLLVGSAIANWPLFGSNFAIRRLVWDSITDKVHRDHTNLHEDMDFSIHIAPTHRIMFKPSLVVGISPRALRFNDRVRRYRYGFRTLMIHWPSQSPWQRWKYKLITSRQTQSDY